MKANKIERKFPFGLVVAATLLLAAVGLGVVVGYDKLKDIYLEQCVIRDMAAQVEISSGNMVKADVIAENLGLRKGANLATIDFAQKRAELLARVPNLLSIRISRKLPDKVVVSTEERTPVARMGLRGVRGETGRVVDTEGMVFIWQRGTQTLPVIRETTPPGTPKGDRIEGRTLAALRLAKEQGLSTLAIVNVVGSTIAREADHVIYTMAGPEIAVATTKAYSSQLIVTYLIAIQFALVRGRIDEERYTALLTEMQTLPKKITRIFEDTERIQWFAAKHSNDKDIFFIGRGLDYGISMEGSLKLKEVSYIHSEATAAGELKHGTISLIENGTLVVGILTQNELIEKMLSNMEEVKSRGAYVLGLTTYGNYKTEDVADFTVYIPRTEEMFTPSLAIIPLQLLAYYISVSRGLDVDKPRNLAKSVTVE